MAQEKISTKPKRDNTLTKKRESEPENGSVVSLQELLKLEPGRIKKIRRQVS